MPIEVRNFITLTRALRTVPKDSSVLNELRTDREDNFAVAECLRNEIISKMGMREEQQMIKSENQEQLPGFLKQPGAYEGNG